MTKHPYFLGIFLSIIGFTFWVVGDSFIKCASGAGISASLICALSGLAGVVFLLILSAFRGTFQKLMPRHKNTQIILALLSLGGSLCNALALRHLSLTSYYAIIFISPVMIAILAHHFLREKVGLMSSFCILTGFGGALIAIDPSSSHTNGDWIGYGSTLLQAVMYSVSVIISRQVTQSDSIESLIFTSSLANALGGSILALIFHDSFIIPRTSFLFVAGAGLTGILGIALFYKALKSAPAAIVSPMHYTQIIVGAIVAYVFWNTFPSVNVILGATLIILSGLYFIRHSSSPAS